MQSARLVDEVSKLRTISLGQKWSIKNLCRAVEAQGTHVSCGAKSIVLARNFVAALNINPQDEFDLVVVPVERIIGLGCGARPEEAISVALEIGFEVCPYWAVFILGLDGTQKEWLMIGELIQGCLFGIGPKGVFVTSHDWLGPQDKLVLVRPRTQLVASGKTDTQVKPRRLVWRLFGGRKEVV